MNDNCSGYQKFVRCQFKAMANVCGWKGKGGKGKKNKGSTTEASV